MFGLMAIALMIPKEHTVNDKNLFHNLKWNHEVVGGKKAFSINILRLVRL